MLAYISDGYDPDTNPQPSIYDSRAHYSNLSGDRYSASVPFPSPDNFGGHGDSDLDIAGVQQELCHGSSLGASGRGDPQQERR